MSDINRKVRLCYKTPFEQGSGDVVNEIGGELWVQEQKKQCPNFEFWTEPVEEANKSEAGMNKKNLQKAIDEINQARHFTIGEHLEADELLSNALVILYGELNKKDSAEKQYLAKFRQGNNPMSMNAIDYYIEDGKITEHRWAMGGESKKVVQSVPDKIEGYEKIYP